ncbi:MAG: hypothetical protein Q7R54_00325 [bacterium]|nr:hypothetical protein [bacterium]
MTFLLFTFALIQAVGAVIGAGGSVFAEIFYFRAIRDGYIDEAERAHLRVIATALRWGMMALLLSSIGLVLVDFIYVVPTQPALTSAYWVEMALALIVIGASWALSRKRISFHLGSAAAFTGWWLIALLVFGRLPALGFGAALALYAVSTVVIAIVLSYARMFGTRPAA